MAKNDNKNQKKNNGNGHSINVLKELKQDTAHAIIAILLFVISIFFLLSAWQTGLPLHGRAGPVGDALYSFFSYLLGLGYFLIPIVLILLGISFWNEPEKRFSSLRVVGGLLLFLSGLGLISLYSYEQGGIVGKIIAEPLVKLFDVEASAILLGALSIISLFIIFDTKLSFSAIGNVFVYIWRKLFVSKPNEIAEEALMEKEEVDEEVPAEETKEEKVKAAGFFKKAIAPKIDKEEGIEVSAIRRLNSVYIPPSLSLLENDRGKPGVGDIKANSNIIKRTMQNFGINVEMDEISIGPSVTRYALKPAEGVKLSKIIGLQNNLSLALAAHPIRIEAPIPGKSLVGIEIPNTIKTTVGLGTLLSQEEFQKSEKPLMIGLGKGISGKSHFANLAKMPHLLVAGATGSGKSVAIHTIITSLLYRNAPENMRFIMVDPKRVELTLYNKIPHLLTPVITDAKKAILALKWAAKEMDRRYNILENESVRDIESYHKNILEPKLKKIATNKKDGENEEFVETLPYIVIIIDELADIMHAYPRELESAIVRLAQMSRAVGIHLILSTQRPSVDIITGLIKANVPARIALQVASQIDSRTILDMRGAEELLGAGDMLYLSGEMSNPQRIQSAYISEMEVKKVVKYLIDSYRDALPTSDINISGDAVEKNDTLNSVNFDDQSLDDDDDLYEEARETIVKAGKASTSYLQRKLGVGYARAARLMDMLEERGVIGPSNGAKPREVMGYEGAVPEEIE